MWPLFTHSKLQPITTPEQVDNLKKKQAETRKQHIGGLLVAEAAIHLGCEVCWEWSRRCQAWKWEPMEPMDKFRNKHRTQTAIIAGTRRLLGKEWRVECTNHQLAKAIHSPSVACFCVHQGINMPLARETLHVARPFTPPRWFTTWLIR